MKKIQEVGHITLYVTPSLLERLATHMEMISIMSCSEWILTALKLTTTAAGGSTKL